MALDKYFEDKKRKSLIFTMHNINPNLPYYSMYPNSTQQKPVCPPEGPTYWSRASGRYRTASEQREFIRGGCIDKKLPPIEIEE